MVAKVESLLYLQASTFQIFLFDFNFLQILDWRLWLVSHSRQRALHFARRHAAVQVDGSRVVAKHGVFISIRRVRSLLNFINLCLFCQGFRWSYGVLLYELYSLGSVPYETLQKTEILEFLKGGQRLEQPQFADEKMLVFQN